MSLALAATQSVAGSAGTASAVTYTITGDELAGTPVVDSFKILAQGTLPVSPASLYSVPAATQGLVKRIALCNVTAAPVTVAMYVNGTAATNKTVGFTIPANGAAEWTEDGWVVLDASGNRLTAAGVGPQGAKGANYRGTYASGTTYAVDDVVTDNGSAWIAVSPGSGTAPPTLPTTSNARWSLLAAKGDTGQTGSTGPPGPIGTINTTAPLTGGGSSSTLTLGIAANGIGPSLMAQAAAFTLRGNNTGATANVLDLSATQVTAMLDVASTSAKGLQSAADKVKQNGLHYDIVAQGGADRTGAADCAAIIEAAHATVAAAGGGVVYYPPGTYRISRTLVLGTGAFVTHRGAGRVASLVRVDFASGDAYQVAGIFTAFEDLRIQGTNATLRTAGFAINFLSTASNCNVRRVDVIYHWSGLKLTGQLARLEDMNIRELGANAPNGQCVLIDAFVDQWIDGLIMDHPQNQTGFAGIRITNLSSLILSNCQVIHCGIGIDIAPTGTNTIPSIYCMNTFFDQGTIGLSAAGSATGTIARCRFIQCWFSSNTTSGALLNNPNINALEFLGCEFYGNAQYGIDAVDAKEWSVRASRIAGNTTAGIRCQPGTVAGNHSFSISDNIIGNTGGFGNNGIAITILAGTYKRYQILDNRGLEQNTTPGYSDLGTTASADTKQVTNNLGLLPSGAIATLAADFTTTGVAANNILTARIPANSVVPGTTFRVTLRGVTAASGNPTFSVAIGTASPGTTVVWTTAAMTSAAASGGGMDVFITVKSIGAGGTVTAAGLGFAAALTASSATATATAINTTVDWYITARVTMSASTFRAVNGVIRAES